MTGAWRLLVLDRDPHDPIWLVATVAAPADVQPAELAAADWPSHLIRVDPATTAWVATASGLVRPVFTPVRHPGVWRVDEGGQL